LGGRTQNFRLESQEGGSSEQERPRPHSTGDAENLLLRVYVPADRLYAAEMHRFLGLFRDWLAKARGQEIRQSGYRTRSGEMFEFFADAPMSQVVLRQELDIFSHVLQLCAERPSKAVDLLSTSQIGRVASEELVDRFGREYRTQRRELKYERDRRMLMLRYTLEAELEDRGVDLNEIAAQVDSLIDRLVPDPSTPSVFPSLASPPPRGVAYPGSVEVSQQFIHAMEYIVIQNVQGDVNIGPKARELIDLIDRFGGLEALTLKSAVYEVEDKNAPMDKRAKAKEAIIGFLGQLGGKVEDVVISVLEKYIESKLGG
jgi:hypothetical protein